MLNHTYAFLTMLSTNDKIRANFSKQAMSAISSKFQSVFAICWYFCGQTEDTLCLIGQVKISVKDETRQSILNRPT